MHLWSHGPSLCGVGRQQKQEAAKAQDIAKAAKAQREARGAKSKIKDHIILYYILSYYITLHYIILHVMHMKSISVKDE